MVAQDQLPNGESVCNKTIDDDRGDRTELCDQEVERKLVVDVVLRRVIGDEHLFEK